MRYTSTRDHTISVTSAQAIAQGISRESGLFVPESLPAISLEDLRGLQGKTYAEQATQILSGFLTDFTEEELDRCVRAAYASGAFPQAVIPMVKLGNRAYMLELWHGPTCAFKDMALQLLPHLLTLSAKKIGNSGETVILTATSGDTGKAALAGFQDVPGTRVLVFYPRDGVSDVQKRQMTTQEGENVAVIAVNGNFDDAQSGVKSIFTDPIMAEKLVEKNFTFSSANSINWGRLAPQIVYYISAYCGLVESGEIALGDRINICVPTGNFGNILAAYYAKEMGLPINKLICASNENKVLTDFLSSGVYDRRRELVLTSSPSMDILVSSNLERLLHALCGKDSEAVAKLMASLTEQGIYTLPDIARGKLQKDFWGGFAHESGVAETIREYYGKYSYLIDTHTAVAARVYEDYTAATGDNTKTIIASTANPYKFAGSILEAIEGKNSGLDEFAQITRLAEITSTRPPEQITALKDKPARFSNTCEKDGMAVVVEEILDLL